MALFMNGYYFLCTRNNFCNGQYGLGMIFR